MNSVTTLMTLHACSSFRRRCKGMKLNGIFECKLLPKTRTVHSAPRSSLQPCLPCGLALPQTQQAIAPRVQVGWPSVVQGKSPGLTAALVSVLCGSIRFD